MLTQLDDHGWEFMVANASRSNNKTKAKYNSLLFEQFLLLGAIYMVAHLFWLPIISPKKFLMELD